MEYWNISARIFLTASVDMLRTITGQNIHIYIYIYMYIQVFKLKLDLFQPLGTMHPIYRTDLPLLSRIRFLYI
jgi:hypothetical protein